MKPITIQQQCWLSTKSASYIIGATILSALSFALFKTRAVPPSVTIDRLMATSSTSRRLSETNDAIHIHAAKITSAEYTLISIHFQSDHTISDDSYSGIIGTFCKLDFEKQKKDPNKLPMFRDLIHASGCENFEAQNVFDADLSKAIELTREYDMNVYQQSFDSRSDKIQEPYLLNLKGAVFHESRCGSTLVSNALVALNPEKNRVYSESSPPKQVLKMCNENFSACSVEGAANLLRDVIYLMGRSNNPMEENMFFKFQSTTTRTMKVFRTAFPSTPWIFLYREPVEVMQSQLDVDDTSKSNCVKNHDKSPMINLMARKLKVKLNKLDDEEICAIHLATICGSAIMNLEDANGLGMALSYHKDMATELVDYIFPIHFRAPVHEDGYKRVMEVSKLYSKSPMGEEKIFKPDKDEKRRNASRTLKDAAEEFLEPSYKKLEKSQYNMNNICTQVNLDARISNLYCKILG